MADELQSSEEVAFVTDEVDRIILSSIESCLKDEVYDEIKVSQWVDYICESIMKRLSGLRKPLKYIATMSSKLFNHAEERCWGARVRFLSLGYRDGRCARSKVARGQAQGHASKYMLHCHRQRP